MTTHKSAAVTSGIMPDYSRAGVVLCRHVSFTTTDDSVVSGDTIQMIPIPSGARIIDVIVEHPALPAGCTGENVGYGGDDDAFANGDDWTAAGVYSCMAAGVIAGINLKFTHDDTIDIALIKAPTKVPTSSTIDMTVIYTMVGSISDDV